MIKIIEKGQKTFIRTCDRCGCKFQYDLSDLSIVNHIICPCCNTTLIHIGPNDKKVGHNDADLSKTIFTPQKDYQPYKIDVGDAGYNYATTTGQYVNPNTVTTISDVTITVGDPNATLYTRELPDDIIDDQYNNIGIQLPDDVQDNCCYESDLYKAWYEKWCKKIKENAPIECKND